MAKEALSADVIAVGLEGRRQIIRLMASKQIRSTDRIAVELHVQSLADPQKVPAQNSSCLMFVGVRGPGGCFSTRSSRGPIWFRGYNQTVSEGALMSRCSPRSARRQPHTSSGNGCSNSRADRCSSDPDRIYQRAPSPPATAPGRAPAKLLRSAPPTRGSRTARKRATKNMNMYCRSTLLTTRVLVRLRTELTMHRRNS